MQVTTLRRKLYLHGFRLWLLLAVVVYSLLGFLLAPWLIHKQLESRVSALTGQTLSIESVRLNPWTLTLQVNDVRLDLEDQQNAAGLRQAFVDFELSSLWNRAWTFAELRLSDPYLEFVRSDDGNTLSTLAPAADPDVPPVADEVRSALPRMIVRRFEVQAGRLGFTDATHPDNFSTEIDPIDLEVEDLSTVPELAASQRLVARTGSGGRLDWDGRFSLLPLTAQGRIEYSENLDVVWRYIDPRFELQPEAGTADVALDYRFAFADGKPVFTASDVRVELSDLRALAPGSDEAVLELSRLSVADGRLAWPEKRIDVGEVRVESPRARAVVKENGALNILDLLRSPLAGNDGDATEVESDDPGAGAQDSAPWSIRLDRLAISDGEVSFADRQRSPAFRSGITALSVAATDLRLDPGTSADVEIAFDVSTGGRVESRGKLGLVPLSFDLQSTIDALALEPAQPYVSELARLNLEDGAASAAGRLALAPDAGLGFRGSASLDGFSATDTLSGEKFFAVGRAAAEGLRYSQRDGAVSLDTLTLQAPFFRIFIAADGSTNLGQVLQPGGDDAPSPPGDGGDASQPFGFSIGSTEISGGTANFTDNSLPIPFATGIYELGGAIGTIGSGSVAPASIELDGRVDEFGSVDVDGQLDILSPAAQSRLDVRFRNVAMPRLSPYTAKFAGRKIANGRLDLALSYRIEDGVLNASNEIVIDELELGERVESADALDLPLGLAIALLKDSQGRISVDIPVSGDLSDPQFSIGGVIGKAVRNLLVSVVAAPFKILAGLIGGSADELDHVTFAPGSAALSPPAEQSLQKLAEAMGRRPQIGLELPAVYAPEADRQAIQADRLEDAIAAEVDALRADDSVPVAIRRFRAQENLFVAQFSPPRLEELEAAFTRQVADGEQQAASQLDAAGYYGAIRNQLRQTFEIATGELQMLARDRAQAIADYLSVNAGIDPARVTITGVIGDAATDGGEVRLPFELTSGR